MRGRLAPAAMYPVGVPGIRSRSVELRDGLSVRVLESGASHGEPVLLIHGWGACVYTFRYAIEVLAATGRRVVAFDLRGHGLSDKPRTPNEYRTTELLRDVGTLLDVLAIARADIVGHSLGGAIALRFALAETHRVRRLVLASPVGLTTIGLQRIGRALTPGITTRFARFLTPRWMTSFLVRGAYGSPGRVTPRVIDEYWAPSQFPDYYRAARALLHRFDWEPVPREELGKLTIPTLVILGGADRLIRGAEGGARCIPGASVVTLDGAGHLGIEECAKEFNEHLRTFLSGEFHVAPIPATS
jgi:pimeloyl-ACP methyl ester carboxylesterase